MSTLSNKSFVYTGSIDEIKHWLKENGYQIEEIHSDGKRISFKIIGTGIQVGYHNPANEYDTGRPKVHLLNGPRLVQTDPESAQRGLELYPKLYRRFRMRPDTK